MADSKISSLSSVASVTGAQEFLVNDAATSKKASTDQIKTYILGTIDAGTTASPLSTIQLKRKAGNFTNGELAIGEAGINTSGGTLWYSFNGTSVVNLDDLYQAKDTELVALAGLISAADRVPYFTGSGTASLAVFTSSGRDLVGAANVTAQRTTLLVNNVENTALSTWAGTASITTLGTIATGSWNATNISLGKGGTGAALTDPDADRILFWDDSASSSAWLALGTNISISGTTLNVTGVITNGAGNNVIPKSDGTNLVASILSESSGVITVNGDLLTLSGTISAGNFSAATGTITVAGHVYGANWNTDYTTPTKHNLYTKIQTLLTRVIVVTSGNFTASAAVSTDYIYIIAGAHTSTMPTAVSNTNRYTLKNRHTASVTVLTTSSEFIEGVSTITISPEQSVDLISDGTGWRVI